MKGLFFASLLLLSVSVHAAETLSGQFLLNETAYSFTVTYDLTKDQEASSKQVNYFESFVFPETGETYPAYCTYSMTFTVPYKVTIKKISTSETVYSKNGVESLLASAGGGLISEQKCSWSINGWEAKVAGQLRINEHYFKVGNIPYRFILDTHALIFAKGSKEATITAQSYSVIRGQDGNKDGEVWLDTQPEQDGNYERIWFPLSLN